MFADGGTQMAQRTWTIRLERWYEHPWVSAEVRDRPHRHTAQGGAARQQGLPSYSRICMTDVEEALTRG